MAKALVYGFVDPSSILAPFIDFLFFFSLIFIYTYIYYILWKLGAGGSLVPSPCMGRLGAWCIYPQWLHRVMVHVVKGHQ